MKGILFNPLIAVLLGAVLSFGLQASETSDAIDKVNGQFEGGFAQGDAAMIADVYKQDGQLLPPNDQIITGYDIILAFWQGAVDSGVKEAKLTTVELDVIGETALEIGQFVLKGEEGKMPAAHPIVIRNSQSGRNELPAPLRFSRRYAPIKS